jgi:putative oxidoreductase
MDKKAISLLLLRASTGIYLLVFGVDKFTDMEHALAISTNYYGGMLDSETINLAIGFFELAVGALVVLGLMRSYSYIAQLAIYAIGIVPIIGYILDPLAMYLVEDSRITFYPSTTLVVASLILIIFKEFDTLSLDRKRGK